MTNRFQEFRSRGIPVHELSSQLWCEKQLHLKLTTGIQPEVTEEVEKGKDKHQELQEELVEVVKVGPRTFEDSYYLRMYNALNGLRTLFDDGKIREVPVFGRLNSFIIQGSIDEVRLIDDETFVLENKTRKSKSMPSQAQMRCNKFQVQLYWRILNDLRNGKIGYKDLEEFYGLEPDNLTQEFLEELDSKAKGEFEPAGFGQLGELVFEGFSKLPPLSKSLKLRYFSQETGKIIGEEGFKFDEEEFGKILDFVSEYWSGEREAVPVGEKNRWKCNYCDFTSACDNFSGG